MNATTVLLLSLASLALLPLAAADPCDTIIVSPPLGALSSIEQLDCTITVFYGDIPPTVSIQKPCPIST